MALDRTYFNTLVDETTPGSGTPVDKAMIDAIYDDIDAALALVATPTTSSWTPVLGGAGGTSGQTYSVQTGIYIKVGKLVVASYWVLLTAKGTITGNAQIQGLPFAAQSSSVYQVATVSFQALATNWVQVLTVLGPSASAASLQGAAAAGTGNSTLLVTADIGNATQMVGTIVYHSA